MCRIFIVISGFITGNLILSKLCENCAKMFPKLRYISYFRLFFGGFSAVNEIKRLEKDLISTHGSHNCQSNVPNPWPELIFLVVSHHVEIHKVHPK